MNRRHFLAAAGCGLVCRIPSTGFAQPLEDVRQAARAAIDRACAFMRSIATRGGYLWSYSADLKDRAGEGKASESTIWVQPPGTPVVATAFLRAYQVTQDPVHLDAARAAADALAHGQLESGGWHYAIDFDERTDRSLRRNLAAALSPAQRGRLRNVTTFDDNTTQSAIRLLLAVTRIQQPADVPDRSARIGSALAYGLSGLLRAQYPNGAFPQGYNGALHRAQDHPLQKASIPADWRQLPRIKEYWFHYTLNDHTHRDCVLTLLEAHRLLAKREYLDAAVRAGDFLLRAQLPAPQPAWAQQYTFDMKPAWARRFEPPAVCSSESAGAVRCLIDLHLASGEARFIAPIPMAIAWLQRSRLPTGQWSRFYELGTNRPLYLNRQYEVVYTDNDLPTHYGFKGEYGIPSAIQTFEELETMGREKLLARLQQPTASDVAGLERRVRQIIASLDQQGRWLSRNGRIETRTFIDHLQTLCRYIEM